MTSTSASASTSATSATSASHPLPPPFPHPHPHAPRSRPHSTSVSSVHWIDNDIAGSAPAQARDRASSASLRLDGNGPLSPTRSALSPRNARSGSSSSTALASGQGLAQAQGNGQAQAQAQVNVPKARSSSPLRHGPLSPLGPRRSVSSASPLSPPGAGLGVGGTGSMARTRTTSAIPEQHAMAMARRRSSQDRRARSEGVGGVGMGAGASAGGGGRYMDRRGSLIGKASTVTGGYETSDSEEEGKGVEGVGKGHEDLESDDKRREGVDSALHGHTNGGGVGASLSDGHMGEDGQENGDVMMDGLHARAGMFDTPKLDLPTSFSFGPTGTNSRLLANGANKRTRSDEGRRRSKSLMSPTMEEVLSGSDRLEREKERERERKKRPRDSRRMTRDVSRSGDTMRKTKLSNEPKDAHLEMGEVGEMASRPSRMGSGEGQMLDAPSPDRKGKGRERPRGGLASSLGLDGNRTDVALSTDQINNLLSDSDVASALRLLHGGLTPHLNTLHPASSTSSTSMSMSGPSRPTSPHTQPEPYIVQAPPALLQDDAHTRRERTVSSASTVAPRRDRNVSVSSSIAPQRERSSWTSRHQVIPDRTGGRARAASRVDSIGGHVPYTHYVPTIPRVEVDEDDRSVTTAETAPGAEHASTDGGGGGQAKQNGQKVQNAHTPGKEAKKEGMPRSRLSQMFHLKRKKSGESLRSDRADNDKAAPKSPAVGVKDDGKHVLVKAKPGRRDSEDTDKDAERRRIEQERRDAELAHERRYKALTQVAAHPDAERAAYKTSSHLRAYYNLIYEGLEHPPRMNPLAVLRWKHKTEEQTEARAKWERERKLNLSTTEFGAVHSSPVSMASSSKPRMSTSTAGDQPVPASKWRYGIDDITAYGDADGIVNYFVPPRLTHEELSAMSARSAASAASAHSARSPSPAAPSLGRSPSVQVKDRERDEGSVADSADKSVGGQARITSASTVSLVGPGSTLGTEALSRSTSNENRRYPRDHRLTHRTHQSLGTMGQHGFRDALKAPFEKLGSVARKQGTNPFSPHTDDESADMRRNVSAPTRRDWRMMDHSRGDDDSQRRETEQRESHLRKLFLKGQRLAPRGHLRPDNDRMSSGGVLHDREGELRALQMALARETAFRERQAERERQTVLEREARERMRVLEDEIYAERAQQVARAKQRLESINGNIANMDDNIRHYFSQIDQLVSVAKVSAEVDMQFPDVSQIRAVHARQRSDHGKDGLGANGKVVRGEASDILGPLRVYDSASGGEGRRAGSNSASRQNSLGAKRKGSGLGPLPPLYSHGIKPWPRRSSLAPDGTHRVDPIRRAELSLHSAREHHSILDMRRERALVSLQGMLATIDALMKQKDAVRAWTKSALENNRLMRNTVDGLKADLAGRTHARLGRVVDFGVDKGSRVLVWPLVQLFFSGTRTGRWAFSWRNESSRRSWERERERERAAGGNGMGMGWGTMICWIVLGVGVGVGWWWLYRFGEEWEE